jgi:hypothetical protein
MRITPFSLGFQLCSVSLPWKCGNIVANSCSRSFPLAIYIGRVSTFVTISDSSTHVDNLDLFIDRCGHA